MAGLFFSYYNINMTEDQFIRLYDEFLTFYNNDVPSMEHEPLRFEYYVKLFLYSRKK
jgi:hypothetical protein